MTRPDHDAHHPVHITMRSGFRPLRSQFVFPTLRAAIADARRRYGTSFRIIHFSVQVDHLHLIVEVEDRAALLKGIRGLAISIARRVNRLVFRKGQFWTDRWHGRELASPRAVRNAIVYVLGNGRKHGAHTGPGVDPFSSAPYFRGFRESPGVALIELKLRNLPRSPDSPDGPPVSNPRCWLLSIGWTRHGLISTADVPRH